MAAKATGHTLESILEFLSKMNQLKNKNFFCMMRVWILISRVIVCCYMVFVCAIENISIFAF